MNRPLIVSLAILLVTTVGLALGTFILHDAEQKEGVAGFVRVTPITEFVSYEASQVELPEIQEAVTIRCNEEKCAVVCSPKNADSCYSVPSKYLKDSLLVSSIILGNSKTSNPDLSWMEMEYFSASAGKEMILAKNDVTGIYLIYKESESEMHFMNFFERAVQVKFSGEVHNSMPDLCVTNYDLSQGIYQWDGNSYELKRPAHCL